MKIVKQKEQLEVMEEMAAQCWPVSYDQVRELMFSAFDDEYGKGNWTHDPISRKNKEKFNKWLVEDND